MAGFTCQICGGSIKMQGNQTGVCQSCGMEYDIEAIRAMAVAPKQDLPAAPTPVSPPANVPQAGADEIHRETLITHLNDVRVLETVLRSSERAIRSIDVMISEKESILSSQRGELSDLKYQLKQAENDPVREPDSRLKNSMKISFIVAAVLVAIYGIWAISQRSMQFFLVMLVIGPIEAAILGFINLRKYQDDIGQVEYEKAEKRRRIDDIKSEIGEAEEGVVSYAKKLTDLKNESFQTKKALFADVKEFEACLEKAYSVNIIPKQFHNIEGVYYLYDYLSTSNQSLSEALMQANLEAIKQKLDNMIRLQSEQIIEQRITNAKLGQVIEYSEATMNNTAVAAQYAQIAAVNSELSVKLSEKQLAYQKATFWLK